ncbi:MAG: hypothetical protein AAFU81_16300, partial [Pseudomonadota bacterium]
CLHHDEEICADYARNVGTCPLREAKVQMILTLAVSGYRSLREIVLPLDRITLVTGAILTLILSPPSRDEGRLLPQVQAPIVWTYSLALIAAFIVILGTSWGAPFVFG